jgi:hypothetical protein
MKTIKREIMYDKIIPVIIHKACINLAQIRPELKGFHGSNVQFQQSSAAA